jgi:hypothetical protein
MLQRLGVNLTTELPVAPNGRAYNPQKSGEGGPVFGPLGRVFSLPKREIFAAGYGGINGDYEKFHALFEDFENRTTLAVLGQDSKNDVGWAGYGSTREPVQARKSVAADLDGDNIDEVVIVTMVDSESADKILINKGEYRNGDFTVTQAMEFAAPESIIGAFAAPDSIESSSRDRQESLWQYTGWTLIAADLNGDGKQECIFTFPKGIWGNSAHVYILDNDLTVSELDITPYLAGLPHSGIGGGISWNPMVTAADYDQDGKDEICIIFSLRNATRNIARYVILDDKDAIYRKLHDGDVSVGSDRISIGNVVAADFTGDGLPDTVFCGYDRAYNDWRGHIFLLKTTINSNFEPVFSWEKSPVWSQFSVLEWDIHIPRIAAGDANGDGKMELYADNYLLTLSRDNWFEQVTGTNELFTGGDAYIPVRAYDVVMGDVTGDLKDDVVLFTGGQIQIYDSAKKERFIHKINTGGDSYYHKTGCLPNVDNDSFILRDTGNRELLFTDPQVIAVLASPPYYSGVNDDGDGGTSFGFSKSSASGSSNSFGFSVGFSIGYEFEAPFGISSAEFELAVNNSFAWTQSSSTEISESWGWNTPTAQDLVLFTAIAFDVYYYEVLKAPPGERAGDAKPGDMLTVNVPRKPRRYHAPLPEYNKGVAEEHRVTVDHTLGDPTTYYNPTQRNEQKSLAGGKGLFSTNTQITAGQGNGSSTINIENVTSEDSSFNFDHEVEISAKAGIGGFSVGASAGFSYGYESTSSVSEGTWIEGTVPAIPSDRYVYNKDFDWGLMAYPKQDATQSYIFVTYWTHLFNLD